MLRSRKIQIGRVALLAAMLGTLSFCSHAHAGYSTWCGPSGKCWTHYHSTPAPVAPAVQYVEPETPADEAARAARVQKWEKLCEPRKITDANGVARFVYAKAGCDTGRTE